MTHSEARAEKLTKDHAAIRRQAADNRKGIERLQHAKKVRADPRTSGIFCALNIQ